MAIMEFQGRQYEVDGDGYLQNPSDWNRGLAEHIANLEGVEMTEARWEVVNILRGYYAKHRVVPLLTRLAKEIDNVMVPEKRKIKYLFELFPSGPVKQAAQIAGLPQPKGCV